MSNIFGSTADSTYSKTEVDTLLSSKTDKVNGKLNTNQLPNLIIMGIFDREHILRSTFEFFLFLYIFH